MKRLLLTIVAVLLAGLAQAALADAGGPPRMQVDPSWPRKLPNNWTLGQVSGVATDAHDHVWIIQRPGSLTAAEKAAHVPAPPVIEFDPEGNVVQAWGGPWHGTGPHYDWFSSEHGVYVDPKGFVWVGGNGPADGQVLKFTRDGKFVLQIGHPGSKVDSNDVTKLGRPADTAVDPVANEVYIADGYGNHRVIVFDADTGAYKRHWGAYGKPPTDHRRAYNPAAAPPRQFGNPVHCVKLARDGLLYVCDRQNDRIQVFRHDGTFVAEMLIAPGTRGMGSVWDLALWPDAKQTMLFNADGQSDEVRILQRADGTVLGAFGRPGRQPGEFHWVHSLAVDSKGDLFTTEVDTARRVQRFVPSVSP